jgi:LPS export ABC transporter protein LptC
MRKITLFLIGILTVAASTTIFSLYMNYKINRGEGIAVRSSDADIRIENARYVETQDGRKEWELEADSAQYFKQRNLVVFDNVKVTFYSKDGINYIMQGKQGRLREDTKDMDIEGDVVVTSDDGYELKTNSLKYSGALKQISTKDKVTFSGKNIKIEGKGFLADMATGRASVLADVRTVLRDVAM